VRIEILGSDVVRVGVFTRRSVQNQTIAIGIPLIPIVARRGFANLVLRLIVRALNGDELAFSHAGAALLGSDFHFPFSNQYFRVIVARNQNPET
jgi:hypothetical protein